MRKRRRKKTYVNETSEAIVRAITGEPYISEEEMERNAPAKAGRKDGSVKKKKPGAAKK